MSCLKKIKYKVVHIGDGDRNIVSKLAGFEDIISVKVE